MVRRLHYLTSSMALVLANLACFPSYDPPPELAQINVTQGVYDPSTGPLELRFTEPVVLKSIEVSLYLGRTDEDFRLCIPDSDGKINSTCTEEAALEVGPCRADPAKAIVGGADNSQLKFECPGGEITVGANNQSILLTSLKGLSPFETYRVVVGAGLEDQAGRTRKVPIESTFQVKSNVPCAPSTLESGFFFTIFNIEAPARGTFQYLFWVQVDAATGQIRLYGTKIVPNDGIDPLTNQNFKDWQINTDPQKESFISASGQTAEVSGEKVIVVHPFVLRINQPKITAEGVELNGLMSTAVIPGASSDQRDVIQGRLSSPAIFLGEGESESNLGPGYGTASFFRLLPSEAPTFEDGIPTAYTAAEIQADFGNCD